MIYDTTRLSRNTQISFELLKIFNTVDLQIYSHHDNLIYRSNELDNHNTDFYISLINAEKEWNTITRRIRSSVKFRRATGHVFGPAPFGKKAYKDARGIRRFKNNSSEQNTMRLINSMKHEHGIDNEDIATRLNSSHNFKRGKPWTASSINSIQTRCSFLKMDKLKRELECVLEDTIDSSDDDMIIVGSSSSSSSRLLSQKLRSPKAKTRANERHRDNPFHNLRTIVKKNHELLFGQIGGKSYRIDNKMTRRKRCNSI